MTFRRRLLVFTIRLPFPKRPSPPRTRRAQRSRDFRSHLAESRRFRGCQLPASTRFIDITTLYGQTASNKSCLSTKPAYELPDHDTCSEYDGGKTLIKRARCSPGRTACLRNVPVRMRATGGLVHAHTASMAISACDLRLMFLKAVSTELLLAINAILIGKFQINNNWRLPR